MSKILMIGTGTGGSEIYNSIHKLIRADGKELEVISGTPFAERILKTGKHLSEEEIIDKIKSDDVNTVITETSNSVELQHKFTKVAKEHSKLVISILDVEGGYEDRYKVLPDKILTPTEEVRGELLNLFPDYRGKDIITVGNPSFDRLYKYKLKYSPREYSSDNEINILYISQGKYSMESFYKSYGYIKNLISRFKIDVLPHPQEDADWGFKELQKRFEVNILEIGNGLEKSLEYDLILGYNSTILKQTKIIGIPTIDYQEEDYYDKFVNYVNNDMFEENEYDFYSRFKVAQTIIKLIEEY